MTTTLESTSSGAAGVSEASREEFAASPSNSATRNRSWLWGLLLVAMIVLAYQPAWHAGFIWDDDDYVTNNPLLTAPDGLQRIWFSTDSPSQYFPLVYTTFRLEHALWGLDARGYHWVNILLHAANALLVWRLLSRLRIPGAWLGAAIFALHPVQVESVAWITELKNVQSVFFSLLALLAWVEFVGQPARGRGSVSNPARASALAHDGKGKAWGLYALALAAYALALFSKTTACTLPATLLLILWLKGKRIDFARIVQVVPFVALGVAMGLLTVWWERHQQGTDGNVFGLGPVERLLVASRAIWFYLGKLLWPANLAFSYPHWTIDRANPLAYAWLAALAGLGVAIFLARRRTGRGPEVAALFFAATLSPLLGCFMLYTFRYTFVADHYQYFALLGPAALAAAGITVCLQNPLLRGALSTALLLALGISTWRQGHVYQDRETLWRATIERNPGCYLAHNNLSAVLVEKGATDEAIAHAQQALELRPTGPDLALAQINLGNARLQQGKPDEAVRHFRLAVDAQPDFANAHNNLGGALLEQNALDEAIVHLQRGLALQPNHADARYNLGNAFLRQGRTGKAIQQYEKALEIRPEDPDVHLNLATLLIGAGRTDEAIAHLEKTLSLRSDYAAAHINLGFVLFQRGRSREAAAHYEAALKLQPENVGALASFAWLLATSPDHAVRDRPRAVMLAQHALELASKAAQPDEALVATLRDELKLYQAGTPARENRTP